MAVTLDEIQSAVTRYLGRHPDERGRLSDLLAALADGWDLSSRTECRGHVTCGALLVDDEGRSLHVRHKTLGRWLFPGGHLDPGDSSLVSAALRELREETGITADRVALIGEETPLDIDLHPIPDNPAREEPGHWHADFLYAFHSSTIDVVLDRDEVTEFAWLERPAVGSLDSKLDAVRVQADVLRRPGDGSAG